MKKFISLLGSLLLCLWLVSGAHAQGVGSSGDIRGTVTDPSGDLLPKVTVTVIETEKGLRRTAETNETGQYQVTGLQPGTYDVSTELSGFEGALRKGVVVTIGQTTFADFQLNVSGVRSEVVVTDAAPVIDTTAAQQANTIEQKYIRDLPINRRDYLTYTLLVPGVSDSTRVASDQDFRVKQTPQSGLSFYGSNGRGNSVTVDGGEFNDDTGGVRPNLSQDAVLEFQINRSNYTAELGGASGASINIVSKSGSNQMHGSVFGFFRDDKFDAASPFSFSQALQPGQVFNPAAPDSVGVPIKDALSRQQFGGSFGFPIKKDKTFMFLAFEGLRQSAENAVPLLTNTNIFRPQNDPLNNQVAIINALAARGPALVQCLNPPQPAIPAATCAGLLTSALTISPTTGLNAGQIARNTFLVDQFERNGGLFSFDTRQYQASARLDYRYNDKNQFFLLYSYVHDLEESPDVQSLTGFSRGSSIKGYYSTLEGAWFHQFSPNTTNEARVQWNYTNFNVIPNVPGQVGLDIPGYANLGTNIFIPNFSILRRYEFADNLTMIRGNHTVKFGGYELIRGNHTESHTFFPGRFVFGNLTSALVSPCLANPAACGLTGVSAVTLNSLQTVSFGLPQFYQQGFDNPIDANTRPFTAFYAQDSWTIRPNFTLNFGLRYELDSQYGNLSTDTNNFAPRFSLAWDPFKDHKTVVRAGFGIFYAPVYYNIPNVVRTLGIENGFRQIAQVFVPLTGVPGSPPSLTSALIFQTLFAQGRVQCTTPAPGNAACITPADLTQFGINVTHTGATPPLSVIFSGQPDYSNPYSEQGEFGVERQLTNGLSIAASYIYVHTLKLPVAIDINLKPAPFVPAGPAGIPIRQWSTAAGFPCAGAGIVNCFVNPLLLQADQYSSAAAAIYNAGIFEIKGRLNNYVTLFANYTLSRAEDEVTDFNSDYGPNDQTNLSAERALSTFDQRHKVVIAAVLDSPWKNRVLKDFQVSPIFRYNSPHPFNLLAGTNINNDRHSTTDRPPGAGRNTGIGPNYIDFDMRLSRLIRMSERANLQLILEGFNIFNRTNFASVNNVVGVIAPPFDLHGNSALSPSQPLGFTSAFPKRQLQFGIRLSF
jgi:Carboxypeptidase regulatory-like domain/TonB dependent receptor